MGLPVRYNGKGCPLPAETLSTLEQYFHLITVCPEMLSGLNCPRAPVELHQDKIVDKLGNDYTNQFKLGAKVCSLVCEQENIKLALLKSKSPSCGTGKIYDGSFSGNLAEGNGLTAEVLLMRGIDIYDENNVGALLNKIRNKKWD